MIIREKDTEQYDDMKKYTERYVRDMLRDIFGPEYGNMADAIDWPEMDVSDERKTREYPVTKEYVKKASDRLRGKARELGIDDEKIRDFLDDPENPRWDEDVLLRTLKNSREYKKYERMRNPRRSKVLGEFDHRSYRITLYVEAIQEVAVGAHLSKAELSSAVYAHELFHAFHFRCIENHGVSRWENRKKARCVKESMATFFEYLYCKKMGYSDIMRYFMEDLKYSGAEYDPYAGAYPLAAASEHLTGLPSPASSAALNRLMSECVFSGWAEAYEDILSVERWADLMEMDLKM